MVQAWRSAVAHRPMAVAALVVAQQPGMRAIGEGAQDAAEGIGHFAVAAHGFYRFPCVEHPEARYGEIDELGLVARGAVVGLQTEAVGFRPGIWHRHQIAQILPACRLAVRSPKSILHSAQLALHLFDSFRSHGGRVVGSQRPRRHCSMSFSSGVRCVGRMAHHSPAKRRVTKAAARTIVRAACMAGSLLFGNDAGCGVGGRVGGGLCGASVRSAGLGDGHGAIWQRGGGRGGHTRTQAIEDAGGGEDDGDFHGVICWVERLLRSTRKWQCQPVPDRFSSHRGCCQLARPRPWRMRWR